MQDDKQIRKRQRRSDEEKRSLLDGWVKSGLSARAFGNREGVKPSCLWRWKRELMDQPAARARKARPSITFAPVHVTTPAARTALPSMRVQAEVLLGREMIVRVFEGADVVQVGQLVRALAGGVSC